jgi:C4-dicarboxylate-specific signal transduction histidine kinase
MKETDQGDRLLDGAIRFNGRITAALSHDINNVVSIISETAGLLSDLAVMAESGRPVDPGKLRAQSERISSQIERGRRIIKHMNRFGHSIDEPERGCDLNEAMDNIVGLSQRFARLKKKTIELRPSAGPVMVTAHPFFLRELVFFLIDLILEADAASETIVMEVQGDGGDGLLVVRSGDFEYNEALKEKMEYISLLASSLGGRLSEQRESDGGRSFGLHLASGR